MTDNEYLAKKLEEQTLQEGSAELKDLNKRGDEVKTLLEKHFADSDPTIKYGGSKAKGTMIKEAYDLDIICYFPRDDEEAGKTLKEIYEETEKLERGGSLTALQELLGHSSIVTTQRYGRLAEAHVHAEARMLERREGQG